MLCHMNRRTLILLLTLAALIIASIVVYVMTRPMLDADTTVSQPSQSSPATDSGSSSSPATGAGSYVEYSPNAIADADGIALLFFHATWCPSCRQIDSEITTSGLPDGVTIIKVDYDKYQDLRQKYGVTIQTTFVKVDASGNEIEKFVPYGGDLGLKLVLDALT